MNEPDKRSDGSNVSVLHSIQTAVYHKIIVQWYMGAEGERRERGSYLQMFINYGVGYICNGIWGREECNGDDPSGILFVEFFCPG